MMDINVEFLQWPLKFSIKKTSAEVIKKKVSKTEKLAKELHKLIFRIFKKRKSIPIF